MFEILTYALAKSKAAKEVKAAVSGKLDKPANPTIGQLLRVKSISDDGDIVLETVDGGGGSGLPDGGTAGQVLVKKSDDSFDTEWNDNYSFVVKGTLTQAEIVEKYKKGPVFIYSPERNLCYFVCAYVNNNIYAMSFTDAYLGTLYVNRMSVIPDSTCIEQQFSVNIVPDGGLTGQILAKKSDTDGDTKWIDPQTAAVRTAMDDVAVTGAKYFLGEQTALSITMPTDAQTGQEIMVVFSSGDTPCTLSIDLDDFDYVPKANTTCKITFTCIAADTWLVDVKEG